MRGNRASRRYRRFAIQRPQTDCSFCDIYTDPGYNLKLRAAARLAGGARYRAYAGLALDLEANSSPLLVYASDASQDLFSARIGCQAYQPLYGIDLGGLCVRTNP
jgi:hypothetical protein